MVPYSAIPNAVCRLLGEKIDTAALERVPHVMVNRRFTFTPEAVTTYAYLPLVIVALGDRDANLETQRLAAEKQLELELWAVDGGVTIKQAEARRDLLLSRVGLVLLRNSTLGGILVDSWQTGGTFEAANNLAAGSIRLHGEL